MTPVGASTDRPVTPVHLRPAQAESPAATAHDPRMPKIMLQRATPEATDKVPTGLGFTIPAAPPSPSPLGQSATTAERTPIPGIPGGQPVVTAPPLSHLGNISVPHVEDAALQKFFHDIAEQLHLIGSASPRSSIAMDSPMASPALSQGGSTAPGTPIPTPGPIDGPILQNTANAPVKPRPPVPTRTQSDTPAGTVKVNVHEQRRRSYLGDATSRENTMTQSVVNQRHSVQMGKGTTVMRGIDPKRKSKRELASVVHAEVQRRRLTCRHRSSSTTSSCRRPSRPIYRLHPCW